MIHYSRHGMAFRGRQGGALLIEVLIAVLIGAFGLLGFAGMQVRATASEFEGFQRSQALVLVEDMVSRMNANRAHAGDYVTAGLVGDGPVVECSGMTGAALDLCEWSNLIRGTSEKRGGASIGSMLAARGCILRPATSTDRYVVAVTWSGVLATGGPASPCGVGDPVYASDALRRAVTSTVCVALLRDPAVAAVTPRC